MSAVEIIELAALGCYDNVNLKLIRPYMVLNDWTSHGLLVIVSKIYEP
jgi:hypothetical protein